VTPRPRPLAGRVVLVVGAGDRATRDVARRLGALGASIVSADPSVREAATTAGLVAAGAGTARVVEEASPPLLGAALLRAATAALSAPTDALVAEATFTDRAAASAAADALAAAMGASARVVVVDAAPAGGSKEQAARIAEAFLAGGR